MWKQDSYVITTLCIVYQIIRTKTVPITRKTSVGYQFERKTSVGYQFENKPHSEYINGTCNEMSYNTASSESM
jgi:hypothetical protein